MSQKAYLLIEAQVGRSLGIVETLRTAPGIEEAHVITGPYSVIAVLMGTDTEDIGRIVTERVHSIPGVLRTISCLGLDGQRGA